MHRLLTIVTVVLAGLFFCTAIGCNVDQLSEDLQKARAEVAGLRSTMEANPAGVSPGLAATVDGIDATLGGVAATVEEMRSAEGMANMGGEIARLVIGLLLGTGGTGALMYRRMISEKVNSHNHALDLGIAIGNGTAAAGSADGTSSG